MSNKIKNFFSLEKRQGEKNKKILEAELNEFGIAYLDGSFKNDNPSRSRFFLCLIRAVLLFLATFGTVGCMISSVGLKYKIVPVVLCILIVTVFISFIYYNKITFYVGYFVFFGVFVTAIISSYWYVNSGFQAYINVLYEKYSDYFALTSLREATEYISNRELTISVMMIFCATCLAVLLNITISGYMNFLLTFLITFPIIQIGLYINARPAIPYLMMVLAAYITVAILGSSSHYKIPDIGKKNTFVTTRKKNKIYHAYTSDGVSIMELGSIICLFSAVFLLITTGIFYSDFNASSAKNKLKATTDKYLQVIMQSGILGLFDRYESVGGLSNGMLGGVSSVRPDYETDLIITFVPQNTDNFYLKAFIGTYYSGNKFTTNTIFSTTIDPDAPFYANYENTTLEPRNVFCISDYIPYDVSPSKIEIQNVGAGYTYNYIPYYGVDISTPTYDSENSEYSYTAYYQPFEHLLSYESDKHPDADYEAYVHETFLYEYSPLDECLDEFCNEAEISRYADLLADASTDEERQQLTLEVVSLLRQYFISEYSYTMAPGATPYNRDVIEYFLSEQKRGYCAHFASSSTMILRHLGIPSRYVEGYMVTMTEINDGTPVSTDISGWVSEDTLDENFETGVISVDVTDGSAHAWTEIYIDGYGWVPFDFTPPSDEEDVITDFSFGSIFSSLFLTGQQLLGSNEDSSDDGTNDNNIFKFNFASSFSFILVPLAYICAITVIILLILIFKSPLYYMLLCLLALIRHNYAKAIRSDFIIFNEKLKSQKQLEICPSVNDLEKYIYSDKLEEFQAIVNKALYSNASISSDEYHGYRQLKKTIKADMKSKESDAK